jgi:uncharacterized membrane protein
MQQLAANLVLPVRDAGKNDDTTESFSRRLLMALRLLILVPIFLSAVLTSNQLRLGTSYCPFGRGCEEVQSSIFARPLGIPLPVAGVVGFTVLYALSFAKRRGWRLFKSGAILSGIVGASLLALQWFVIGNFCPICVVIDLCSIGITLLAINQVKTGSAFSISRTAAILWSGGGLLALVLPFIAPYLRPPADAPAEIRALWVPSKVTIVEVVDFRCRYCRAMDINITRFLDEVSGRVHFVRLTVPMATNPQSKEASQAFVCASLQDKGDEMAQKLFEAKDASEKPLVQLASQLGLNTEKFKKCLGDPAIEKKFHADLKWLLEESPGGVPAVWIQNRVLFGLHPVEELRKAFAGEESKLRESGR